MGRRGFRFRTRRSDRRRLIRTGQSGRSKEEIVFSGPARIVIRRATRWPPHDRHIVAIGPLPPPLHGLSLATSAMIDLLVEDNTVVVANLSPSPPTARPWRHPAKLARVLAACNTLFRQRRSPGKRGYIACDGGLGQIYTLLLVVTARLLSYPTYLHHHSFRYIDNEMHGHAPDPRAGRAGLTHVFLGEIDARTLHRHLRQADPRRHLQRRLRGAASST
jgi:hypothetical protein